MSAFPGGLGSVRPFYLIPPSPTCASLLTLSVITRHFPHLSLSKQVLPMLAHSTIYRNLKIRYNTKKCSSSSCLVHSFFLQYLTCSIWCVFSSCPLIGWGNVPTSPHLLPTTSSVFRPLCMSRTRHPQFCCFFFTDDPSPTFTFFCSRMKTELHSRTLYLTLVIDCL